MALDVVLTVIVCDGYQYKLIDDPNASTLQPGQVSGVETALIDGQVEEEALCELWNSVQCGDASSVVDEGWWGDEARRE